MPTIGGGFAAHVMAAVVVTVFTIRSQVFVGALFYFGARRAAVTIKVWSGGERSRRGSKGERSEEG